MGCEVRWSVQVPTKLTKRQKELLQELAQTTAIDNKPQQEDDTLIGKVKEFFN